MSGNPFESLLSSPLTLTDLDGIFCPDWLTGSKGEEDDPVAYLRHITVARPIYLPPYPVLAVVTGRLERYRQVTREWLRRHNIVCEHLVMMDVSTVQERKRLKTPRWKASIYRQYPGAALFVESDAKQAWCIRTASGYRPVYDWSNQRLCE